MEPTKLRNTVSEGRRRGPGFARGHGFSPGGSPEQARKAWATRRAKSAAAVEQAERDKHEQRVEAFFERVATVTAERLVEKALQYSDVAISYAGKVAAGEEKGDKARLQAAGLILGLGHANAPKRVISASLTLKQVLDRDDNDVIAEALAVLNGAPPALPAPAFSFVDATPALVGQEEDIFS